MKIYKSISKLALLLEFIICIIDIILYKSLPSIFYIWIFVISIISLYVYEKSLLNALINLHVEKKFGHSEYIPSDRNIEYIQRFSYRDLYEESIFMEINTIICSIISAIKLFIDLFSHINSTEAFISRIVFIVGIFIIKYTFIICAMIINQIKFNISEEIEL